jgi:23S rRNA (uridine2552-2'-O)-methyltransferase
VDLGAAPGGWSQVAAAITGPKGRVVALDILEMDPIENVDFIHGDFTEPDPLEALLKHIGDTGVNLVMSDMAPNISGIKAVDQPRSMYLAELALDLAQNVLISKGDFLVKVFQGTDFDIYYKQLKSLFNKVYTRKPKASKSNSREVYLLARGYNG